MIAFFRMVGLGSTAAGLAACARCRCKAIALICTASVLPVAEFPGRLGASLVLSALSGQLQPSPPAAPQPLATLLSCLRAHDAEEVLRTELGVCGGWPARRPQLSQRCQAHLAPEGISAGMACDPGVLQHLLQREPLPGVPHQQLHRKGAIRLHCAHFSASCASSCKLPCVIFGTASHAWVMRVP